MFSRPCLLMSLTAALVLSGCARGPKLAPVRGRVICNGKAVPEAGVVFSPVPQSEEDREPGKAAQGGTDAEGRYVLTTYQQGDGALVGRHRVSVILDNTVRLPCKTKVVVLEVQPGDNELDIDLGK